MRENTWVRIHAAQTVIWTALTVPSVLWWKESIPWLVFMSAWALVGSNWAAFQGAHGERQNDLQMKALATQIEDLQQAVDRLTCLSLRFLSLEQRTVDSNDHESDRNHR